MPCDPLPSSSPCSARHQAQSVPHTCPWLIPTPSHGSTSSTSSNSLCFPQPNNPIDTSLCPSLDNRAYPHHTTTNRPSITLDPDATKRGSYQAPQARPVTAHLDMSPAPHTPVHRR